MKKGKSPQKLLSRQELLEATGLSSKALKQYEEAGYVAAAEVKDGVKYYTEETSELIQAMTRCLGRCANLQEAHHIALQGLAQKERRGREAESAQLQFIDPTKVKLHTRFEGLLRIDEDLAENLSADMAVGGYFHSQPIVLATWPGQEEPVLIDGHTRLRAATKAGVPKIPYVVEKFRDIDGALEYVAKVQTQRRPTDDWVRYQLICEIDSLMDRGGDRRSEQAKSKSSQEPIETKYANSAERTAALTGTSPATVKRARRINRDGWPSLLEAMQNREMTITQAEKAIAEKAKTGPITEEELQVEENKKPMVQLTDANFEVLEQLDETVHYHVNKAVRMYIRGLQKMGRLPKE